MKWAILLILITLVSCGKSTKKKSSTAPQNNFSALFASSQLKMKVFYEKGAEPYADSALGFSTWDLLQKNLEALFQGRDISPAISVPKTLTQMTKMENSNKSLWSAEDILNAAQKVSTPELPGVSNFTVLFLNGHSKEGQNIIGLHIGDTKIIALFKDVIRDSGNNEASIVPKYVEQATLIHEMGHALGLVNNGLPMATKNHHDSQHGAHCTNPDCVMYHSNEGTASMVHFIKKMIQNNSIVMFDKNCLNDTRKFQN